MKQQIGMVFGIQGQFQCCVASEREWAKIVVDCEMMSDVKDRKVN